MNAIECLILAHRYLYHSVGKPIISDYEYDMMERRALKLFPESEILNSVGSSNQPREEVIDMAHVISGHKI